jgi:peptidyl-tRNA hydrolase
MQAHFSGDFSLPESDPNPGWVIHFNSLITLTQGKWLAHLAHAAWVCRGEKACFKWAGGKELLNKSGHLIRDAGHTEIPAGTPTVCIVKS